ncbi:MAG: glycosyl transferase [Hydrogenophilales bacterium 28-61-23]|nr:MAG: glycosyl transferase [Hydrogenophilales bacterium 28-61-23]
MKNSIRILGTRGVPAAHGGFETFAEHLAPYLVERGWQVTVYCQEDGAGPVFEDSWCGVRRVRMPVATSGAAGTIVFDWKSTVHAAGEPGLLLTLGYNTAMFCALYRLNGLKNVINMDGVEWRRQKWGGVAKLWFWLNDWAGCWLGNHLVADHPEIKKHLATRVSADKITMIPYGSDRVDAADAGLIAPYGLTPGGYAILIARAEPENSILEVVRAWSRKPRGCKLVVLGKYEAGHVYQRAVQEAASAEVIFPGAVYEKPVVQALRFHARFYVHGHQVGGTNPSLVEALGAGNAVLAHDNCYNRWVAGDAGVYFRDEAGCALEIERLLMGSDHLAVLQNAARDRHARMFTWEKVLGEYENLLLSWLS